MTTPHRVTELVERARPVFAKQDSAAVGAALADLTAIWLAGHVVRGEPAETDRLRETLLRLHVDMISRLTAVNAEEMGTKQ